MFSRFPVLLRFPSLIRFLRENNTLSVIGNRGKITGDNRDLYRIYNGDSFRVY